MLHRVWLCRRSCDSVSQAVTTCLITASVIRNRLFTEAFQGSEKMLLREHSVICIQTKYLSIKVHLYIWVIRLNELNGNTRVLSMTMLTWRCIASILFTFTVFVYPASMLTFHNMHQNTVVADAMSGAGIFRQQQMPTSWWSYRKYQVITKGTSSGIHKGLDVFCNFYHPPIHPSDTPTNSPSSQWCWSISLNKWIQKIQKYLKHNKQLGVCQSYYDTYFWDHECLYQSAIKAFYHENPY